MHKNINGHLMGTENSDSRQTPNQSKSFRVLQQITDSMDKAEYDDLMKPAELHQPLHSRPLGPNDMNEHQLRKLQINNNVEQNQGILSCPFHCLFF